MSAVPDWSGASGGIWARRWRDTDRALSELGVALDEAIRRGAPGDAFHALDVGCGPGTTTISLAGRRPDASILGCDLSEALVTIARQRAEGLSARFATKDAEKAAREYGPFQMIFSRHGVMFFDDPYRAFRNLRTATSSGGRLSFSCFQSWDSNPWASDLASAAAGARLPAPGREPGGFAFADVDYVRDILLSAGWVDPEPQSLQFHYVAAEGAEPLEEALNFFIELGPAARLLEKLDGNERESAIERLRHAISQRVHDSRVIFPAAAWIWSASAE